MQVRGTISLNVWDWTIAANTWSHPSVCPLIYCDCGDILCLYSSDLMLIGSNGPLTFDSGLELICAFIIQFFFFLKRGSFTKQTWNTVLENTAESYDRSCGILAVLFKGRLTFSATKRQDCGAPTISQFWLHQIYLPDAPSSVTVRGAHSTLLLKVLHSTPFTN